MHFHDLHQSTKLDKNDAGYLPVVIVVLPSVTSLNLILGSQKSFAAGALILSGGQNFVYQDLLPIQHILDKCEKLIVLLHKKNWGGELLRIEQIIPIINNFESRCGNEGTHDGTDSDQTTDGPSKNVHSDER